MEIWTWGYFPFSMGGSVHRPIKCAVSEDHLSGPCDIGQGYQAYIVTSPAHLTYVVEASTGALIGPTIEDVRHDIEYGNPEFMAQQMIESAKNLTKAQLLSFDEFWEKDRNAR